MQTLWQDLRYGARMLFKHPGFAFVAVLTLALGIGATTAVFSVVNGVLLRPLPYAESDKLVTIWGNFLKLNIEQLPAKAAEFLDYRAQTQVFAQTEGYSPTDFNLNLTQGGPERVSGAQVTAGLFDLLGAPQAIAGRWIALDEAQLGRDHVVVLSHGLWQQRFGGDRNVVGQTLHLNGEPYTVIGVMPTGFDFPAPLAEAALLWTPVSFTPAQIAQREGPYYLHVLARLRDGVTVQQAQREMNALGQRFEREQPGYRGPNNADGGWRITVVPALEQVVGRSRQSLRLLLTIAAMVLLIACANVANLLLARATTRQRELAVRAAVGASRARIVRQLLVESVLLAALGGALGVLLASWGVDWLLALNPAALPRLSEIKLDRVVLGFSLAVSLLVGALCGLAPAWLAGRVDLNQVLKEGGAQVAGDRRQPLARQALVAVEIALACVALVGAGLLIRSFLQLQRVDRGLQSDHVLTGRLSLPAEKYREPAQIAGFYNELTRKLSALPGVEAAAISTQLPLSGRTMNDPFSIEGRALDFKNTATAGHQNVSPAYFRALGIQALRGRDFNDSDTNDAPPVAVINERMARAYWPNEDPIGRRITLGLPRPENPWRTIIGIARDTPQRGLEVGAKPDWYLPSAQAPQRDVYLLVRASLEPIAFSRALREQVAALDPAQPITDIRTLDEVIAGTTAPRRFNTTMLGLLAAIALLLAALGSYSVLAYTIARRTHELGVRAALGARPSDLRRLVIWQGMRPVAVGVAGGLVAAWWLARLVRGLLFGIGASDPLTFAGAVLLLLIVAIAACWLPARRATRVDPLVALRHE